MQGLRFFLLTSGVSIVVAPSPRLATMVVQEVMATMGAMRRNMASAKVMVNVASGANAWWTQTEKKVKI